MLIKCRAAFTLLLSLISEKCLRSVWTHSGSFSPLSGVYMSPVEQSTCAHTHTHLGQVSFRLETERQLKQKTGVTYQCIQPSWSCHRRSYQCLPQFPTWENEKILLFSLHFKSLQHNIQYGIITLTIWVVCDWVIHQHSFIIIVHYEFSCILGLLIRWISAFMFSTIWLLWASVPY